MSRHFRPSIISIISILDRNDKYGNKSKEQEKSSPSALLRPWQRIKDYFGQWDAKKHSKRSFNILFYRLTDQRLEK